MKNKREHPAETLIWAFSQIF